MPAECNLSVVMSVYNNSGQLKKTIDSILKQTYADFEVIIINDGSTDDSQQILQTIAAGDRRIRLFQQPNKGLTNALVFGCEQAASGYIARHDVGDCSSPDRFAKQFAYLQSNRDCAVVFSQFRSVDEAGHVIYTYRPTASDFQSSIDITRQYYLCSLTSWQCHVQQGTLFECRWI